MRKRRPGAPPPRMLPMLRVVAGRIRSWPNGSGGADARSLKALGAFLDLELDLLALLEGAIAVHLDGGEVDEHVRSVRLGDESVALLCVEPLHGAGRHCGGPPSAD